MQPVCTECTSPRETLVDNRRWVVFVFTCCAGQELELEPEPVKNPEPEPLWSLSGYASLVLTNDTNGWVTEKTSILHCAESPQQPVINISVYRHVHKGSSPQKSCSSNPKFCSLAVLDPRDGHTMDVLSLFISVLCHSDWIFHRESCPHLDVVQAVCGLPHLHAAGRYRSTVEGAQQHSIQQEMCAVSCWDPRINTDLFVSVLIRINITNVQTKAFSFHKYGSIVTIAFAVFSTKLNTYRVEKFSDSYSWHDTSWTELISNQRTNIHHCPETNERQGWVKTILQPTHNHSCPMQ